jgi:hypothetical protein
VYLNNWSMSVQVMLSAIDNEMDRCLAELRMLGSEMGSNEEKFKINLNLVAVTFFQLCNLVKTNADTFVREAVNLLYGYVNMAKETILPCDFATEWSEVLTAVEKLHSKVEAMSIIPLYPDHIRAVCTAIRDGLSPVRTFPMGESASSKGYRMLTLLKNIGDALKQLRTGDGNTGFYTFLNTGTKNNDPEKKMLKIIDILSKCTDDE